MKKIIAILLALTILIALAACSPGSKEDTSLDSALPMHTVVDLAGREVELPANPTKVAALVGPSFEKLVIIGASDKIVLLGNPDANKGWAKVVAPELGFVTVVENATEPNIEELLTLGVEVVFFWDSYPDVIAKLEDANIPVIVTQIQDSPDTLEKFLQMQKDEINLIAQVMGEEYVPKAMNWCDYLEEKVSFIRDKTKDLPADAFPDVFYIRGPSALRIHGKNSYSMWWLTMAGGNLVSKDSDYEVTIEQVLKWDPEYVFMGRVNNSELITGDVAWSGVRAVKENKVIVNPKGVMVWDAGTEGVLLLEFFAKTLHPDLFPDLDIKAEIKDYYSQFYHYPLSDTQVEQIYNNTEID